MALTINSQTNSNGVVNQAQGRIVTDAGAAAALTINLGFVPRKFIFINLTARQTDEWYEGMAANSSLRTVAAGTRTLEVAAAVTVNSDRTIVLPATMVPLSSVFAWTAEG